MEINQQQAELENILVEDINTNHIKTEDKQEVKLSNNLDFLKGILSEEVISKLTLSDLSLSLSDLILKLNPPKEKATPIEVINGDNEKYLQLKFNILSDQVSKIGTGIEHILKDSSISLSLKAINETETELCYIVKLKDDTDIHIKNKTEELDEYYNTITLAKEVFDDLQLDQELLKLSIESELPVSLRQLDKKYLIKVPIAKKGTYHHPVYNVLDFSDEMLATIEDNIKANVVGYPIPITCGHRDDGAKKEGELVQVYREGDILFGEWEVNKEIYRQVEDGDITFSSAEFFPNYINKLNGEPVGRTLFGMALTNRPFMPNQPRVITLNDHVEQEIEYFSSKLNLTKLQYSNKEVLSTILDKDTTNKEVTMPEDIQTNVADNNATILLSEQVNILQQQLSDYHNKLALVETEYKQKLSEYSTINEQLSNKIQKYEDRIKEEELNAKLAYLSELKLPTEVAEKYTDLIKSGSLGESEEVVLTSLAKLSQLNNTELFTQHGYTNSTAKMNDEKFDDPYAKVIEYNKKLTEAKKLQTLNSLSY